MSAGDIQYYAGFYVTNVDGPSVIAYFTPSNTKLGSSIPALPTDLTSVALSPTPKGSSASASNMSGTFDDFTYVNVMLFTTDQPPLVKGTVPYAVVQLNSDPSASSPIVGSLGSLSGTSPSVGSAGNLWINLKTAKPSDPTSPPDPTDPSNPSDPSTPAGFWSKYKYYILTAVGLVTVLLVIYLARKYMMK